MCKPKICFDRVLENTAPEGVFMAWGLKDGWLDKDEVVTFRWLDGNAKHRSEMATAMREVESFTCLKFRESVDDPLLRFTTDPSTGSWQYVGNDNNRVSKGQPTGNFGWYGVGTKRHELGHALGAGHGQQNPKGGLDWDKEAVYEIMAGAPNNWSRAQTDWNFFRTYAADQIVGTERDEKSIMHYSIAAEMLKSGKGTPYNEIWSKKDIEFFGKVIFPKKNAVEVVQDDETFRLLRAFYHSKNSINKNYAKVVRAMALELGITTIGKKKSQLTKLIWETIEKSTR